MPKFESKDNDAKQATKGVSVNSLFEKFGGGKKTTNTPTPATSKSSSRAKSPEIKTISDDKEVRFEAIPSIDKTNKTDLLTKDEKTNIRNEVPNSSKPEEYKNYIIELNKSRNENNQIPNNITRDDLNKKLIQEAELKKQVDELKALQEKTLAKSTGTVRNPLINKRRGLPGGLTLG